MKKRFTQILILTLSLMFCLIGNPALAEELDYTQYAAPETEAKSIPALESEDELPLTPVLFNAVAVETGVMLNWSPFGSEIGYRVFRSKIEGELGVSITDFPILNTMHLDFNVDEGATYHYTVEAVIKNAVFAGGVLFEEILGPPSEQVSVTTNITTLGVDTSKSAPFQNIIVLTIGDPIMTVNGSPEEIDPGRGTAPII
ncbi:MAG: fibronectin type III domain-containing protein, partial [Oscillospiraceae bacterium]|nr:fibronectin type III domain-containing protein [Oscillospiraceae bacterium]